MQTAKKITVFRFYNFVLFKIIFDSINHNSWAASRLSRDKKEIYQAELITS